MATAKKTALQTGTSDTSDAVSALGMTPEQKNALMISQSLRRLGRAIRDGGIVIQTYPIEITVEEEKLGTTVTRMKATMYGEEAKK